MQKMPVAEDDEDVPLSVRLKRMQENRAKNDGSTPKKAKAEPEEPVKIVKKKPVELNGTKEVVKKETIKESIKKEVVKNELAAKKEPSKKEFVKKEPVVKKPASKIELAVKKASALKTAPSVKKESMAKSDAPKKKVVVKKETKEENIDEGDEDEFKWWLEQKGDSSVKWETLEHAGPYFPPPYEPINIPLLYEGKELFLEPEAEEVAGFFAALLRTDHAQNEIFVTNFFEDFKDVLRTTGSKHVGTIREFAKCDWTKMYNFFDAQREARRNATKEEKEAIKIAKKVIEEQYGFCHLDGRREKVGNFRIEPPGLFRGRGKHPKAGKLKTRVHPEQVTINVSHGARVPDPPAGHSWGTVQHDNTVTWLATWTENVNKAQKYVFLAAGSSLKGQSDVKKFETARQLHACVSDIRTRNREELHSKEMAIRQMATALWLIDNLALRAGNEKGDDEADTVGCCSLRLEHVTLKPPNVVVFDFLGKDSIRYYREVEVDPQIVKNLGIFMRPPKTPSDPIFDRLNTGLLNKYLGELMPGLTAKVFRTYNASNTFQRELDAGTPESASVADMVLAYNRANRQVAILCNHQRSVPKTHDQAMERLREKMWALKYQRYLIRRRLLKTLEKKEQKAIKGINDPESDFEISKVESVLIMREKEKLAAKTSETVVVKKEPINETPKKGKKAKKDEEDSMSPVKSKKADGSTRNVVEEHKHRIEAANSESLLKKWTAIEERIAALKTQVTDRDENKTTALGTSKTNYIDPRITAAWCAKTGVPVEKMFTKTLRDKFKWAMGVDSSWTF